MQIETVAVERLIPYARNSRTHSEAQVQQIAASITEYGFTNPVLIDAKGQLIAGHRPPLLRHGTKTATHAVTGAPFPAPAETQSR